MTQKITLTLQAPLSGVVVPLECVPDPVFAQKLVGDGVSIDPTSQSLLAPCSGKITMVHPCSHALTMEIAEGVEIMMHIGIDTVQLKGRGFTPRVKTGDQVASGQVLIDFDADGVATKARSLLTQILFTDRDRLVELKPTSGGVKAGTDLLLMAVLKAPEVKQKGTDGGGKSLTSEGLIIPNPTGIHARPAAVLVNLAKRFQSEVHVQKGEKRANARSVVSLMTLDIRCGDKVYLMVTGTDADEAMRCITQQIVAGLGEKPETLSVKSSRFEKASPAETKPAPAKASGDPGLLFGMAASPGYAVGRVRHLKSERFVFSEDGDTPDRERSKLESAMEQAQRQLSALQDRMTQSADAGKAAIFAAHLELLEDPDVLDVARSLIAKGKSAPFAWEHAFSGQAERLSGLSNELLAARANDLRDVGRRVMRLLLGSPEKPREFAPETILIAEDLTPSDTANLDRGKVLGFCTVTGGATSHVAILARSLGIPAIAGIEPRVLEIPEDSLVLLDGNLGSLKLNPSETEVQSIRKRLNGLDAQRRKDLSQAAERALTTDGHQVMVVANIGGVADAEQAVKMGAEGVGLLRSEFLFMQRTTSPSEDEQYQSYLAMARALGPERTLTIRTLDVGGDKPLAYLPISPEENPFLGERGIRVFLDRPELLKTQLRAILRASQGFRVQVMFPMITNVSEWQMAHSMLLEEASRLGIPPVPAGIMIEVPAAALLAEHFAREAEFFSIGTNDLTQYTLAMDRGHPKMAPCIDGLHPAVLQLIARTIEGARIHHRPVSVCGGLAGESVAVPILIGLGVEKLSVSVPAIPGIKARIRRLSLADCRTIAELALKQPSGKAVRSIVPADISDGGQA